MFAMLVWGGPRLSLVMFTVTVEGSSGGTTATSSKFFVNDDIDSAVLYIWYSLSTMATFLVAVLLSWSGSEGERLELYERLVCH